MLKSYLSKVFGVLALLLAANGLACWYIDPYAIFRVARLDPPEPYAAELLYYLRVTKAYQLEYLRPDALIMGSSRASTLTPALLKQGDEVAYNAALPGATSYEMWRYLHHAFTIKKPRQVVIGLDYESFLTDDGKFLARFEQRRLAETADDLRPLRSFARHAPDYWASLASAAATTKALSTYLKQKSGNIFYSDGTWFDRHDTGSLVLVGQPGYDFIARQYFQRYSATRPRYSLEYLQEILDECHSANIDVVFYISPAHNLVSTVYQYAGHGAARQQWQRDIVGLIESSARRHNRAPYVLWGFEDNAIVAGDPAQGAQAGAIAFKDGLHFSVEFGNAVIRQIIHAGADKLGTPLNSASIDAYLETTSAHLATYQQEQPERIAQLRRNLGI